MKIGGISLEFNPELDKLTKRKSLRDGLSAIVQIGNTLWLANDETVSLERLTRQKDGGYSEHVQFRLDDYVRLPAPVAADPEEIEEVDIEGLDYSGGYLWLVGSHSLKRSNVSAKHRNNPVEKNFKRLREVRADGNKFLLARIPVKEEGGGYQPLQKLSANGKELTADQLRGGTNGNDLTEALATDDHLKPFFVSIPDSRILPIPGKDNGFDIEGLAVAGERLFLGLRGPVLRGWAMILEITLQQDDGDPRTLVLKQIGPKGRPYKKHFLHLGGLGIRDLCLHGSDLLILAGPTMDLDGPTTIFRWRGGASPSAESMVFADELQKLMDVPFGPGVDHAEGMTIYRLEGTERAILIVYDAPSPERKEGSSLKADLFTLPAD